MRERHGRQWRPEDTQALIRAIESGQSIASVALALCRSERAIRIRVKRLGIISAPELNTNAPLPLDGGPASRRPPAGERTSPDFGREDADDEDDPLPDRLQAAVIAVIGACVSDPRSRSIALQVLGLHPDGDPATMADVARAMNLSRERIRQLRNSVLSRMTANAARRVAAFERLRGVLDNISAETRWADPASAARWIVKLATNNFAVAGMFTYIVCRAAGSALPRRDLRQQCATAAKAACIDSERRASWRFDRWADALTKAVFHTAAQFESPPADLIGAKRTPGNSDRDHDFSSKRFGRTVSCESTTETRVFRWLERSADVHWYQEQPSRLLYEFEGMIFQYFPDCAVLGTDGRVVVVEVKPIFHITGTRPSPKPSRPSGYMDPEGLDICSLTVPAERSMT
jgi:hypothetical protein